MSKMSMLRVLLILILILAALFYFSAFKVKAYSPRTTHAALTQEIIEFYNLLHPDRKITSEQAEWIIEGSIDEDRDIRAINHFYDPVRNIGWTGEGVGSLTANEVRGIASVFVAPGGVDPVSTIQWVNDRNLQAQYYSRYGGDKTWTQALEYFYAERNEEAYYTLGHVLHLLEDMAVPEHTRNDLHPPGEGSPYEAYAEAKWNRSSINSLDIPNKLIRGGASLPSGSSIENYLRSMALYSNRYFFSKDSINDPSYELILSEDDCSNNFCYGIDEENRKFPVAVLKIDFHNGEFKRIFSMDDESNRNVVFDSYFTRLAEKSILHGAAVIDLFYNDAKDYIPTRLVRGRGIGNSSILGEISRAWNATRSFFANIGDGIAGIFSNSPEVQVVEIFDDETVEEASEIETTVRNESGLQNQEDDEFDKLGEVVEEQVQEQVIKEQEEEEVESLIVATSTTSTLPIATSTLQTQAVEIEAKACSFEDSQTPALDKIVINEVAWMGTTVSPNDEWIELKNISASEVDISGFQILDKAEQIKINFEAGEKIPAGGFYVLERTNDDTLPNLPADIIYTGALSNTDEGLRLFDSNCSLIDEVAASPDWPGGSNSSKGTMERKSNFGWQTSAVQGGTPRAENSVPSLVASGGGSVAESTETSSPETETSASTSSTSTASAVNHVLISEVQVAGADAGDEFVELYNPTTSTVDMSGWSIQYVSGAAEVSTSTVSKKNFLATSTIEANEFFLIARNTNASGTDGYVGSVVSDFGHRTFSLSGVSTGAKIFLVSNQEAIDSTNDADIVDFVDYSFSVPSAGQSLERRSFENNVCDSAEGDGEFLGNGCDTGSNDDFNIRLVSNPQNSESLPEPRSAPIAVASFSVGYHFSTPTLTMDWDESQDYTGSTSTITYQIEEINTPTSSAPFSFNATSTVLEQVIDEIGRNYEFTIKAVDVDGLSSTSTVASTTVPSFFDNLYFYQDPRASSTEYLVNLYYSKYPFVSDPYWGTPDDDWKIMVFYHNSEAVKGGDLSTVSSWNPMDLTDVLAVKYNECSSGSLAGNYRMILPDNSGRCGVGGGLNNSARIWSDFEDNHLQVRISSSTDDIVFSEDEDYVTVAFYSLSDSGGGNQSLKLVAVDKNKYLFRSTSPAYEVPSTPTNLTVVDYTVNSPTSTVEVSWDGSSDADTLDNLISYELSLDNATFQPIVLTSGGEPKKANLSLALGSTSTIHIRAVDDFSATSTPATTTLVLPEAVVDTTPDPSNSYFAVDEAKIENNILKMKWRLISAPDTTKAFGIIPYLSASGTPVSLDNYRALHRDYDGVTIYPIVTGQESTQCNAAITSLSDYTFGWQYETRFSTVGDTPVSSDLVGQTLEFALYTRNASAEPICNIGDAVGSPFFTGLPVVIE